MHHPLIRKFAMLTENLPIYWWLIPMLAIPISAWVHVLADLSFPVPWSDELYFIWPAKALSESGGLQTPGLNPERAIWMHPPGYKALLASVFLFFEPGIIVGRWSSWVFVTLAYWVILKSLHPDAGAIGITAILTLFYLGQHAVIAGNVVRPEALLIAMYGVAFWLLQKQRFWGCLALLAMAVLVHPISVLPGVVALFAQARTGGLKLPMPCAIEWALLGFALLVGTCVLLSFLRNPSAYFSDLMVSARFLHLGWEERFRILLHPRRLIPTVLFALIALNALRLNYPSMPLALLGLAFWSIHILRPEMWYSIYTALAYAILSAQLLVQADILARRMIPKWRHTFSLFMLLPIMATWNVQGFGIDPRHYPYYMWWRHMTIRDQPRYHDSTDEAAVVERISKYNAGTGNILVRFYPPSEGVLYTGRLPPPFLPFDPTFTEQRPAIMIFRLSALAYPGMNAKVTATMNELGQDQNSPFHVRDQTEQWFLFEGPFP